MTSTPRKLIEALYRELARLTPERATVEAIVREIIAAEPRMRWLLRVVLVESYLKSARETARQLVEDGAALPRFSFVPPIPPLFTRTTFPGDRPPEIRFPGIEAAADWLNARQIVTGDELRALDSQAASAAFQIARVTTREGVAKIRDAVTDTIRDGKTLDEFHEEVADVVDEHFSPAQVETLFRTNVGLAQAAGQRSVMEHPSVESEFPYRLWTATHDARVRPEHLAMETFGQNGTAVYRADDPMWDTLWPPCSYNCRCNVIPLTVSDAAAHGSEEARLWLKTGSAPVHPYWVRPPYPIIPPEGWPTHVGLQAVA